MIVHIPSPLHSYTSGNATVNVSGTTLFETLDNLDAKYPGIRFRMIDEQNGIRQHIKIFVNRELVHSLDVPLNDQDVVKIVTALSGG